MSTVERIRWPRRLVVGAALITSTTAAIVLVGSAFGFPTLVGVVPGGSRMVPATALAFLLAAMSLAFTTARHSGAMGLLCAIATALIGALRLRAHLSGWDLNFDFLGLPTSTRASGAASAQMSPATALNFLLIGSALILASRKRAPQLFEALVAAALLVGWLGLTPYVYGGEPLTPYAAMTVHTAALFLILAAGTAVSRADTSLMRLLTSSAAGGASARRLLPAAVILPLALTWVPVYAEHARWLESEAGLAVLALLTIVVFGALIWFNALSLERTDVRRRQAEHGLRESEERTRLIIENALDAVIAIDSTGVVRDWSPQAEVIFGWTSAEAIGRPLTDLIIPAQYHEAHRQGMRRYLETGEARVLNRRIELVARHRKGHEFPVEIAIAPLRTDADISFSAFVRDITERRHSEDVLRESERRLRTLAESLPHLVWTCRPDGWCDFLSHQWLEYTGRSESEQIGYGWAGQLHPDDRERVRAEWAEATLRGDSFDTEFRIRRADGVYRWFKTRAVPLRDSAGHISKWFGSNTDMEDYKVSERRLRAQLERMALLDRTTRSIGERQDPRSILQVVLRSLEDDLPIDFACVCVREGAQHVLTVARVGNKSRSLAGQLAMAEQTTIEVDENGLSRCLRGQLVYEPDIAHSAFSFARRLAARGLGSLVIAPLIVESKVFGVLIGARRGVEQFSSSECEFLRQLSEHVALSLHQAELYTALQQAYDDLRRTQQTVVQQERLRALGQMAGGIAHDINNALSPASLYVESLLEHDSMLSARARESLAVVQRAIADVANTVTRMREFYRPQEPTLAHHLVNLNELVEQVIDLTRARWSGMPQERGAVIHVQTDLTTDLPQVQGMESDIRDALTNLVLNAVDAMPDGGRLTLRTSVAEPDRARIDVMDTGVGMSEETRARCLEPFFTTKGERGTGLGLAMVYGMLERHSGEIEIESEPGKGTMMRLTFPAVMSTSAAESGVHPAPSPLQPLRILFVDDDPIVLRSVSDVLQQDGHSVTVAEGGQSGIDVFCAAVDRGESFSIVITDLGMPHVDGRRVAAAVKASAAQVPVVLLTGWGQRLLVQNEKPPYVDRVLSKPPKLGEIRQALAELTREPLSAQSPG